MSIVVILEESAGWEPTRWQWRCWIAAHLTLIGLVAVFWGLDQISFEDRPLRQLFIMTMVVIWSGITLGLAWIPVWLDQRLHWFWKLVGTLSFVVTLPLAWFVEFWVLLFGMMVTGNFDLNGIQ